jgi:hypothetical protein
MRFAILETLDIKDSDLFRSVLKGKKWEEVTPEKARKRKTYENNPPDEGELEEYANIAPDWFYLSGHHGRGTCDTKNKRLLLSNAPTGFFNEPFHKKEFETARREIAAKGMFVQTESVTDEAQLTRLETYWRGRFAVEGDPDNFADMIPYWLNLFSKPTEGVTRPAFKDKPDAVVPARKGLFFANQWPGVRLIITEACNTLVYNKDMYQQAFPNALVLGYINKNPLDSTPHVRAFLANVFDGITNPKDPLLLDHDHISQAWMNVHFKQKLADTERLAFMTADGTVFGIMPGSEFKPPATQLGGPNTYISTQGPPPIAIRPMPGGFRFVLNEGKTRIIEIQTEPD